MTPSRRRDGGTSLGKAVVLIAVLVLVGIVVLDRSTPSPARSAVATSTGRHHHQGSTSTTVPAPATTTTTVLPPSQVKVQVLNGVLTGSLAGQWSAKLRANPGYTTEAPLNATSKVAASVIYVLTPGYLTEADALAAAVGLPASAVNPTVPPPSTAPIPAAARTAANLVLVVGPDLAGSA